MENIKRELSAEQRDALLDTLRIRFEKNQSRHTDFAWLDVQAKLEAAPAKMWSLYQMEETGGEPDVVEFDFGGGKYIFCDCSAESPKGRRSLCYDRAALDARKEHKPKDCAVDVANSMGIELLSEDDYRSLQTFGEFDLKTSSWIKTPTAIRDLGGALFCERRYNAVFVFHNGAESYYAARGFRGLIKI